MNGFSEKVSLIWCMADVLRGGYKQSGYGKVLRGEHASRGHSGQSGPGLPRMHDGSLLLLPHMLSKMKPLTVPEAGGIEITGEAAA